MCGTKMVIIPDHVEEYMLKNNKVNNIIKYDELVVQNTLANIKNRREEKDIPIGANETIDLVYSDMEDAKEAEKEFLKIYS